MQVTAIAGQSGVMVRRLLALNAASTIETSPLDKRKFEHMLGAAFYAGTIDGGAAMLLAFDQSADYDSPNFIWFRDRHARFVYIDRVIVVAAQRGQGLARALYDDLVQKARSAGHALVACEVNVSPPNPASDAFHDRMGFVEVGRQLISSGKTVRYLTRSLSVMATDQRQHNARA